MTKLEPNEFPAYGEKSWLCPGTKVFSLIKPDNRKSPRAHRFALKTPHDFTGRCNPLRLDKYYIHAYQVQFVVGNYSKSLNSRKMASALGNRYPDQYHPRSKDIVNTMNIPGPRETIKPTLHNTRSSVHPLIQPTPFMPITNLPQPYHAQGLVPYGAPFHQPSVPYNALQPTLVPRTCFTPSNLPPTQPYTPPATYAQAANTISQWHALPTLRSSQAHDPAQRPRQGNSIARKPTNRSLPQNNSNDQSVPVNAWLSTEIHTSPENNNCNLGRLRVFWWNGGGALIKRIRSNPMLIRLFVRENVEIFCYGEAQVVKSSSKLK